MTRDESGPGLYETIKCIGGIIQLREMRAQTNVHRIKPGQLKDWGTREQMLLKELAAHMPKLSAEDAGEVVVQYPWVASC